ncbi:F-box/kelch-repeat protein At3g23880-like [Papaver somniferum]|uniref:F-box/kelch-repeat protein At3g23880-like n=1 Tax=Papaver somniferum TaxID=3469 RepID=UPI000E6F5830|nr:F-box/kelch-repeat protein At3g23880-like [Papaver somniferum]
MSSIPEEIYFEILIKVPAKSLLACKYVCKTWYSLISNPDFVKMQLNLTLEYPFKSLSYSATLMGCCDGLVCLWFDKRQFFCVWNPVTREDKVLPKSNMCYPYYPSMVAFGYDYKSNEYKLLVASESLFEVFLLRTNSWKRIEIVPYELRMCSKASGLLVNGDLHWLAERTQDSSDVLVSIDISKETFKELELPETLENNVLLINLGVLEGLILSFKGGEILFGSEFGLLLYDPECGRVKELNISSLTSLYQDELYFESLVSLKSNTYVGREEQIEERNKKNKKKKMRKRA